MNISSLIPLVCFTLKCSSLEKQAMETIAKKCGCTVLLNFLVLVSPRKQSK